MKLLILIILQMLFTQCCSFLCDDDELSLPLIPYTGNELRIDGYYYQIGDDGKGFYDVYFFYKNGIILNLGGGQNSLYELDEYVERCKQNKYVYSSKIGWGIFVIEGNNIKFERWYPKEKPYYAYVREGIILNDTTFHITKSYRSNGTNYSPEDEIYYFRKFSPKPDSTNNFIK